MTASATLATAGQGIWHWYEMKYQWRAREYSRLSSLRAGFTSDRFDEVLGAPTFSRVSFDKKWIEYTYDERDYWVQSVTRPGSATVAYFAVTTCSPRFNPTFSIGENKTVRLGTETLADVSPDGSAVTELRYQFPGATANAYMWEIYSGGNPSNYKAFAWGYDDACGDDAWETWLARSRMPSRYIFGIQTDAPKRSLFAQPGIAKLRRQVIINSYAETAPTDEDFPSDEGGFQIGPDRILTRTVGFPRG